MSHLPIHRDEQSFREQTEKMFREMQERMGQPANLPFGSFMTSSWPKWPETDLNNDMFFQLQPRVKQPDTMVNANRPMQSEILDDATTRSLFFDLDPHQSQGQGRMFRMSFDAREYDPAEVSVRCEDGCLVVEAKHVGNSGGSKVVREFNRRIQLPAGVDPTKLTSALSADGILTVQAPVPPQYHAIAGQQLTGDTMLNNGNRLLQAPSSSTSFGQRASPITVRMEDGTRSRSPQPVHVIPRISPVPFSSTSTMVPVSVQSSPPCQLDVPVVTVDQATGRKRMDLVIQLGSPYTAGDVVVKVDGRRLLIEAKHESSDQGRVSTSSTQRQFQLNDDVDETSVKAKFRDDGKLSITGFVR